MRQHTLSALTGEDEIRLVVRLRARLRREAQPVAREQLRQMILQRNLGATVKRRLTRK